MEGQIIEEQVEMNKIESEKRKKERESATNSEAAELRQNYEEDDMVTEIKPEGEKVLITARDLRSCKTDNVWQIDLELVASSTIKMEENTETLIDTNTNETLLKVKHTSKFIFLNNPKDSNYHIFVKFDRKSTNFVCNYEQNEKLKEKLEQGEIDSFLNAVNMMMNHDDTIRAITSRSKVLTILGIVLSSILFVCGLGMLAAGIYTSKVKAEKSTVDKWNFFPNTYDAPFYIIFFLLIFMTLLVFFNCVMNSSLKEYHLIKQKIHLYTEKLSKLENKYNKSFKNSKVKVQICPLLDYIQFNLDNRKLIIPDLF